MKKPKPLRKNRWLKFIGLALIIIGAMLILSTYLKSQDECMANPLQYGAKQLTKSTGYEFQGWGSLVVPINTRSPTVFFNSTHILIDGKPI